MVAYAIRIVCTGMLLLKVWVMLGMLCLMRVLLVLEVVHHRDATPSGSIDTPMLLVALIEHAVLILRGRVGRAGG